MLRSVLVVVGMLCLAGPIAAADEVYDVVVYGGTPGGVTTAVAAAREGAKVLVLEQMRHVGGLNTSGLNNSEVMHMHEWTFSGISGEFYARLAKAYGRTGLMHRWESSVAQKVFDTMLAEARVPVRYQQRVVKVEKDGPRIRRIVMQDGTAVAGKTFVDCSYEGDLMARAGVSYTWGREGRDQYGEPLAGVRLGDPNIKARTRDANGNLLPGISDTLENLQPGAGDKKVQNYNFRLTLVKDKANKVPFSQPRNYAPERYALLANYLKQYPNKQFKDLVAYWPIVPGKYEANNHQCAIISLGHFGGQLEYPDADYATQDCIYQDHVDYTQGFFWFLLNDPRVPAPIRAQTAEWGLAKDEFVDNGNWPYYLYIREGRRMIGPYVMTQKDLQTDRKKPDSIGLGSHYIDAHHVQRVAVSADEFTNEGRLWTPGKVYEIPYRAITPKADQCENMLVPVAASFSHVAFCAFRLEPTWMTAGHAAGVAAALAAREGVPVQQVQIENLQERLTAGKQLLWLKEGDEGN